MAARAPSPRLPLFSIRLSPATKSRWQEAASKEGRTLAGYIKDAVDRSSILADLVSKLVWYCEKCDRWQDKRTGCEADIRYDQRQIDADFVSSVGCICGVLGASGPEHDDQCPQGIAEKMRGSAHP